MFYPDKEFNSRLIILKLVTNLMYTMPLCPGLKMSTTIDLLHV